MKTFRFLTSESIEGTSLPLESVDHVHGGDGLPLGVLGVGDGVPDYVLEKNFKDSTGFLIDQARPEIRFTPPRRANLLMAGLVMPWILSRRTFL